MKSSKKHVPDLHLRMPVSQMLAATKPGEVARFVDDGGNLLGGLIHPNDVEKFLRLMREEKQRHGIALAQGYAAMGGG